jgi:hypothetical protein
MVSPKAQDQGAQISLCEAYFLYAAARAKCSATPRLGFGRNHPQL